MLRRLPRRTLTILVRSAAALGMAVLLAASRDVGGIESPAGAPEIRSGEAQIRPGATDVPPSGAEVGSGSTAPVVASTRPHALSCKPSPPVVTTLLSGGALDTWHVRLEALVAVSQVDVSMGARSGAQDLAPVVVWRGSLAQGETRQVEVRYAPPSGATEVWVDASTHEPGAVQRSRAAVSIRDGRAVAPVAVPLEAGRVVLDPVSGLKVLEVVGTPGGSR